MNDGVRPLRGQAISAAQGVLRRSVAKQRESGHLAGFSRAASLSLQAIQARQDDLKDRMKGEGLTRSEQALYVELDELKSQIEAEFDSYWQAEGVDWRPRKSAARRSVGVRGDDVVEPAS